MKNILIVFLILGGCLAPLTYSQIGYECTVAQAINGSNLYISLYIRSTGASSFILGNANFRLNVNTSGLNITNIPGEISEGLWDNGYDSGNYADQINGRNATDGWVSINIENLYNGGGVEVPTSATLIGTMSIPILNTSLTSDVSWRVSGLNKTEVLDHLLGDDITAFGTFTNPLVFPLPVELTTFTSKLMNDKVLLNWSTKTEVNNFGFDVERKVNGDWQKIGFVQGNGNSNSPKEYSFSDNKLIGGSTFNYRLKQIDNDGQFEYSKAVEVVNVPTEFALYQNFPNPFNPSTKIRYQLPNESKVVIKIYNILGSEVLELLNENKEPGIYEVEFNADNLSSGTYIYKISADNFVQTKKMILLK